ncbi:MAG TPA: radical SAM protein [Burkholderiales bacterium]|nr:radical SAM protein [Burkholderiales bacterium]
MRLLLINPRYPESFWSFKWAVDSVLPGKRAINPPLGLATLAALCPPHWQVTIVDENVEPVPLAPDADIVGVCGMGVQAERQKALLEFYRARGHYGVAGGSYASLCPEQYADCADTVVAGESEYIWPAFCRDFEAGGAGALYREAGVVALADSPTPRFDLLKLDRYTTATLQFSRGCPFMCEFCDIIVMFGRKPRFKELAQVGRELDALRALGARNLFFVDDNLIGNKPVARALLRYLAEYQEAHGRCFNFGTEVSLNLAQDAELLALFRAAGFTWVFTGIESSDPETLKATRKTQNTHEDSLVSVRRLYAHGIDVLAGFIVGFDRDTPATFEVQHDFILNSGIQAAMIGLLTALPRTPLYQRLEKEGRLRHDVAPGDNSKLGTNVEPKSMPYETMVAEYRRLHVRLFSDAEIAGRIRNKMRYMADPVYRGEYSVGEQLAILAKFFVRGVLRGGPGRVARFLSTVPWRAPRKLPLVIVDWIAGLAMRDYIERHFHVTERRDSALVRARRTLRAAAARYADPGQVAVALRRAGVGSSLSLRIKGAVDRDFFRDIARPIERLLANGRSRLDLHVDELCEPGVAALQDLLERLRRHGDRVSIFVAEKWRAAVAVDSSVFHHRLQPAGPG